MLQYTFDFQVALKINRQLVLLYNIQWLDLLPDADSKYSRQMKQNRNNSENNSVNINFTIKKKKIERQTDVTLSTLKIEKRELFRETTKKKKNKHM